MGPRETTLRLLGEVTHRHEADKRLNAPGTALLVRRGVLRSLVMKCPDNCGDTLTINLDRRAGPAWRLYRTRHGISLYPSVWRDSGCQSHFILWRSHVLWCEYDEPVLEELDDGLKQRVLAQLGNALVSYSDIADVLDEVPWSVLAACRHLVKQSKAVEGAEKQKGMFRKNTAPVIFDR